MNAKKENAQKRYSLAFENLFLVQGYYDMLNPNQGNVLPSKPVRPNQPSDTITPDGTDNPARPTLTVHPNPPAHSSGQMVQLKQPAQTDAMSEAQNSNATIYTALDQSTRVTFSKKCTFINFVKTTVDVITESTNGKMTLDCSSTPGNAQGFRLVMCSRKPFS